MKKTPYQTLFDLSKHTALLQSIEGLLHWDQETYLPSKAIDLRGEQLKLLAGLIHKSHTSASYKKALQSLIDIPSGKILEPGLSEEEKAALREWRRDHLKMIRLPASFVKKFSETTSKATHIWAEARRTNNFKLFAPHLEKIVKLLRAKAEYLGYVGHPYNALLDLYEPEMTTDQITPLFGKLKTHLTPLIRSIQAAPKPPVDFLQQNYPKNKQLAFSEQLFTAMGFNDNSARLDLTNHPFCSNLHPLDTRMTTRVHLDNPLSNIFSVIHEGGHGLYSIGRNVALFGSPLCESVSLGIEESQSRFWETCIGHSYPFWQYFYPHLQQMFPENLGGIPLDDFYRAINIVTPSLIRVEADEVTYSMHVILRYEAEMALIDGSLKVKDLPEYWNEKMRDYLGVVPTDPSVGCLQDIHWSLGAMGYFPTYTLGNLYAAQLFDAFKKKFPHWEKDVAKGDFAFIRNWLQEGIHQYGRQYAPAELIKRMTGSALDEHYFLDYLTHKYRALYHGIR